MADEGFGQKFKQYCRMLKTLVLDNVNDTNVVFGGVLNQRTFHLYKTK